VLRAAALRLCAAWVVCSALGFLFGDTLLRGATPLLSAAVHWIAPELQSSVSLIDDGRGGTQLLLDARTEQPLALGDGLVVPAGQALPSRANGVHVLVPLVILCSALFTLPARDRRERALLVASILPLGLAVLLVTAPFQLVGLIELALQDYASSHGVARADPLSLHWMLFLESGGRWVLPLLFAAVSYAGVRRFGTRRLT